MKWVYLTTAPDQLQAEMWRSLLEAEEVSALVRQGDTASYLGVSAYPCRIMVPEAEIERARVVMEERLCLEQNEG